MFGEHRENRLQRRLQKQRDILSREKKTFEDQKPQRLNEEANRQAQQIQQRANTAADYTNQARKQGLAQGQEFMNLPVQGLDPKKKQALQYEAQKQIHRNQQSANRNLLGEQSQRGIGGRSGIGYAQQADLNKAAQEAQGAASRGIDVMDADMAMKNRANLFAMQEGFAAQSGLDRQMAQDELRYEDEQRRQRNYEDMFLKQYEGQKKPRVQLTPEQHSRIFNRL